MNQHLLIVALLLLGGLLGLAECWRLRGLRRYAGLAASVAATALLYFVLFPPLQNAAGLPLVVLTAGATAEQLAASAGQPNRVALPGSAADASVARMPDLATALRRRPRSTSLQVFGDGLGAADRDAARGLPLQFEPAALPRGIVELQIPPQIRRGHGFELRGRVQQGAGGLLALREPGSTQAQRAQADAQGEFRFSAVARQAATLPYTLELLGADGKAEQSLTLPLQIENGNRLRLLLLSGGPDPDLKYLQRWALDAGHEVRSRISLSRGIAQQRGDGELDDASLTEADIVVIDERAWAQLDKTARSRLLAAVDNGLGLLLRLGGTPSAAVLADWQALGLGLKSVEMDTKLQIAGQSASVDNGLQRLPLQADAAALAPLARAADGKVLGVYANRGLGRVGAWWLLGTQSLVTSGQSALHDALWSAALDALTRPRQPRAIASADWLWRGERSMVCAGDAALSVREDDGGNVALIAQRSDEARWCAGYWPRRSGWQLLQAGDQQRRVLVHDPASLPSLYRAQRQAATQALAGRGDHAHTPPQQPGPRWPWFLAWLVPLSLLWWLQRQRARQAD
ncbi:hypothetical protein DFR29_108192 [Tahibacter aquaticus]|uniref:Carboxypeptidase regulatory-like domain-containing protein n=1 Tax=Tahibacter aquaticus TaxID=520092 RepID=A0A4R6YVC5_9GAMM|nr:hypothetical protein [Tahibacter aquaticus]TDR42605.1 hypothetical protein DFR29_108192 [Tahibacter aquaticus]